MYIVSHFNTDFLPLIEDRIVDPCSILVLTQIKMKRVNFSIFSMSILTKPPSWPCQFRPGASQLSAVGGII